MSESAEAEARLLREAARLRHEARRQRRASAPWRYGLATLWVALAFAYCRQWGDVISLPPGAGSAFLVAVALGIRCGGAGPGWAAFALSLLCWLDFYEPGEIFPISRFSWFVIALLTPLIIAGNPPHSDLKGVKRRIRRSSRLFSAKSGASPHLVG